MYAWGDLVTSRINSHIVARNNAQNRRMQRRGSRQHYLQIIMWRTRFVQGTLSFILLLLFHIEVRLQSKRTQISLFKWDTIDFVNRHQHSKCQYRYIEYVHMVVVAESRVSHTYQEKVYERRGGEGITYANCAWNYDSAKWFWER